MTDQPREPQTKSGRRLFTDQEPMDMLESDGVTWEDVLAIEAGAAADALRATGDPRPFSERDAEVAAHAWQAGYDSAIVLEAQEREARKTEAAP